MKMLKKIRMGAALAVFTALPAFAADPVLGTWQTAVDDGAYAYVAGGLFCSSSNWTRL